MALLLGKYDSNLALKAGGVREQLDYLTDELFERVTVCALLDPPPKYMQCFMFNVETHEFEQYPDNWWRQVAQVSIWNYRGEAAGICQLCTGTTALGEQRVPGVSCWVGLPFSRAPGI